MFLLPTDQPKALAKPLAPVESQGSNWLKDQMSWLAFIGGRLLTGVVTFLIITAVVYAMTLIVPAEERARPYLPPRLRNEELAVIRIYIDQAIEKYGLDDPYPVQYTRWLGKLAHGDWGFSSTLRVDVLEAIKARSPATLELTLYSLLLYIPMGVMLGTFIAWKRGRMVDRLGSLGAYITTALPPFVLGLVLISIVYVQLGFFDLSRIGYAEKAVIQSDAFTSLTGLITVDGLLNGRLDIFWQAIRHLVLPVITLSALHLASLTLVTRSTVVEELQKEYILLARGIGLKDRLILFRYALKNALVPALNHSAVTAAQVMTGVYVVEAIFNWHGVSELLIQSLGSIPDVDLALGFSVYSIVVVLVIVLVLDIVQGIVDPRVRAGGR